MIESYHSALRRPRSFIQKQSCPATVMAFFAHNQDLSSKSDLAQQKSCDSSLTTKSDMAEHSEDCDDRRHGSFNEHKMCSGATWLIQDLAQRRMT